MNRRSLPLSAIKIAAILGAVIFILGELVNGVDLREIGVVLMLASWTRLGIRIATRPANAAYQDGYKLGHADGYYQGNRDGRRVSRLMSVPDALPEASPVAVGQEATAELPRLLRPC